MEGSPLPDADGEYEGEEWIPAGYDESDGVPVPYGGEEHLRASDLGRFGGVPDGQNHFNFEEVFPHEGAYHDEGSPEAGEYDHEEEEEDMENDEAEEGPMEMVREAEREDSGDYGEELEDAEEQKHNEEVPDYGDEH